MTILLAALLAVQTVPTTSQEATPVAPIGQRTAASASPADAGALIPDDDEDPAIIAAAAYPLGSVQNPVRVGGPEGERAYLGRLRCAGGDAPQVGVRTDLGEGAFGSVVAGYRLSCGGTATTLVMDMYHDEHREDRAPAGFTIAGQ